MPKTISDAEHKRFCLAAGLRVAIAVAIDVYRENHPEMTALDACCVLTVMAAGYHARTPGSAAVPRPLQPLVSLGDR